jgi:hypothetical protein
MGEVKMPDDDDKTSVGLCRPCSFKGLVLLIEGLGDGRDPGIADPLTNRVFIDVGGMTHKY